MRVLIALLLTGCGPTFDGLQCGSTEGFISGTITGGSEPVSITATQVGTAAREAGEITGRVYELNLQGGFDYVLQASDAGSCGSEELRVTLQECDERQHDFTIDTGDCPEPG